MRQRRSLTTPGFLLLFLTSAASGQNAPDVAKLATNSSKESQACIACHMNGAAALAVQQWALSRHAQVGIGCYECHQADKGRPDAFEHFGQSISVMVTPNSCGMCHAQEAEEFQASHHAQAGQILIASPMLGRPEVVAAGQAGTVVGGAPDAVARCRPLFGAIAPRVVDAGPEPAGAAVIKIANNFVLGCAIEALGEGFSLIRKYGVTPDVFYNVLADGLFNCSAYKSYGRIIAEQKYLPAGQRAMNGLKDANLALTAAEAVGVPLPSGNVWRDRLVGAVAHNEGEHDWAVMAKDQARASGLA